MSCNLDPQNHSWSAGECVFYYGTCTYQLERYVVIIQYLQLADGLTVCNLLTWTQVQMGGWCAVARHWRAWLHLRLAELLHHPTLRATRWRDLSELVMAQSHFQPFVPCFLFITPILNLVIIADISRPRPWGGDNHLSLSIRLGRSKYW